MSDMNQPAGLTLEKPLWRLGYQRNRPHQEAKGFMRGKEFKLGIAEFDDQGQCYDRKQLNALSSEIETLRMGERDVIIIVFAHGWKHNGRTDDENLVAFEALLEETAKYEASSTRSADGVVREVYGIFVAWRGLSLHGLQTEQLTFWKRQRAGQRVSTGSVRELFGRLRHYRNHRIEKNGSPLLVIVGHSFGGMIVYSALAQSLIEAASTPVAQEVPRFADLVLLVNPAIEAARYLPIHCQVQDPMNAGRKPQLPVFVCATAKNDLATKIAFPLGNVFAWLRESVRGSLERKCLVKTIGHVEELMTHTLTGDGKGGFVLGPDPMPQQSNPFWVATASPAIINRHNGIFQEPFLKFAASLVFVHVDRTKATGVTKRRGFQAGFTGKTIEPSLSDVSSRVPSFNLQERLARRRS